MPRTDSPLRYPGGKSKLYSMIQPIIAQNVGGDNRTYIEPFAGGCGLALKLLHNGDVDHLVLNDIDYNVYCFWNTCLNDSRRLCEKIAECNINMNTWQIQRDIYCNAYEHSELEVAFSTFFLNRCNVSGIIRGGPIGGHKQQGSYGLDARFNREDLIEKIRAIYDERNSIDFFNQDARAFLQETIRHYGIDNTILNIDPPYVKKGPALYENSFLTEDHRELSRIIRELDYKWIVTYDECKLIYDLYNGFRNEIVTLHYSAGQSKQGKELLIYSDNVDLRIPIVM